MYYKDIKLLRDLLRKIRKIIDSCSFLVFHSLAVSVIKKMAGKLEELNKEMVLYNVSLFFAQKQVEKLIKRINPCSFIAFP